MDYSERLQNVSVLGAAGKMGSGILLLTLLEMADISLRPESKGKKFMIHAIDVSEEGLMGLMKYLRNQVIKNAERRIVALRRLYKDYPELIENSDVIDRYVTDVLSLVMPSANIESAFSSSLVFEAIKEDPGVKAKTLSLINGNNHYQPWFFTNTSSIPIEEIDKSARLGGRIIGFHFYNPPAIQKLVEIIQSDKTLKEVAEFAATYAKNLRKTVVPSHDVAGFIGNGHFMRDIIFASGEVSALTNELGFAHAVYAINKISQDYLVRPMGIFQLIDYVGVDVCNYIMGVMHSHNGNEDIRCPLLEQMLSAGIAGGQFSDGTQKDGILKYEKGKVTGIYEPDLKQYKAIGELEPKVSEYLGKMPDPKPWKQVVNNPGKEKILTAWFHGIMNSKSRGAELTVKYALKSKEIGMNLVANKVAFSEADVNTVLLTGFFHAYGPINDYVK